MIVSSSLKDFTDNAFLIYILPYSSVFLVTSSLLLIIEYALSNKDKTAYNLFGGDSCGVDIGQFA